MKADILRPEVTLLVVSPDGPQNHPKSLQTLARLGAHHPQVIWLTPDRTVQGFLPNITVVHGTGDKGIKSALDSTHGKFVMIRTPDELRPQLLRMGTTVRRHTELAEKTKLLGSSFPLPVLGSGKDRELIANWAEWVDAPKSQWLAYRDLLPFVSSKGVLDHMEVAPLADSDDGWVMTLKGRVTSELSDSPIPSNSVRIQVEDADGTVIVSAHTKPRLRIDKRKPAWVGFTAQIPLSILEPDQYTFSAVVHNMHSASEKRVPIQLSNGGLYTARTKTSSTKLVRLEPCPKTERALLFVEKQTFVGWLRWTGGALARDFKALFSRRRFWWARILRVLTRPLAGPGPIWLVGERPDTAQDNGWQFFRFLSKEHPRLRAYYLSQDSPNQKEKLKGLRRVIKHSSFRHKFLMLHADALINAYSMKHMTPNDWHHGLYAKGFAWRIGSKRVYLKHGINQYADMLSRSTNGFDLYLTASNLETDANRETSGYDQEIVETGLCRYDALVPTEKTRTILYMPTWRKWLSPGLHNTSHDQIPFIGSDYQVFLSNLLSSPELHALLEKYDFKFELLPHYNMRTVIKGMESTSDRVQILDVDSTDLQAKFKECNLFLTDFSSVQFDIAYLGTPIVYTHFDLEDFRANHGRASWFTPEENGFGPIAQSVEETVELIENYVLNGFKREPFYDARADKIFTYRDHNNNARTMSAIEALENPPVPVDPQEIDLVDDAETSVPDAVARGLKNTKQTWARPKDLQAYALGLRELRFADELADKASCGSYNFTELTKLASNGISLEDFPHGVVPKLIARCATVAAGWSDDETSLNAAAELFKLALEHSTPDELPKSSLEVALQVLSQTSHDRLITSLCSSLDVSPETSWASLTDLLGRTRDEKTWLNALNRPFRESRTHEIHLTPIDEDNSDLPRFDRLSCDQPAAKSISGPLISVVVPVFEPDSRLITAVKALVAQTWENLEIIVVDDGSPNTESNDLLPAVESLDSRIRVIRASINAGAYTARNIGLREARGTFVTYADADDWTHPERLARQVQPLLENPALIGTFSNALRTSDELETTWLGAPPTRVNRSSLLHRRNEVLDRIGYFCSIRKGGDTEYIRRIATVFGPESLVSLDFIGGLTRLDSDSLSRGDFQLGWSHPSRRLLLWAISHWHEQIEHGADPKVLPETPAPFPVPHKYRPRQDSPSSSHFDVIVASSVTPDTVLAPDVEAELEFLAEKFQRVGVLPRPYVADNVRVKARPSSRVLDQWFNGQIELLNRSEQHSCALLVVRSSQLVSRDGWLVPDSVIPEKILVMVDSPTSEIMKVSSSFAAFETHWLTQTDEATRELSATGLSNVLNEGLWGLLLTNYKARSWTSRAAVLSPDSGQSPESRIRELSKLVGGNLNSKHILWENKDLSTSNNFPHQNPPELVSNSEPLEDVLIRTGIAVIRENRRLPQTLNVQALRAMSVGCVPLVSEEFRDLFGDSALYLDQTTLEEAMDLFSNDPDSYTAQVERGYSYIETNFNAEKFKVVLDRLLGNTSAGTDRIDELA